MNTPKTTTNASASVRQPVLLGLFTGTAVGAGYLLAAVPNVELMTLIIALCGGVLGPRSGFATGALAASIYSLGSPYGLPVPLLLVAQVLGMGTAGVLGAIGGNLILSCSFKGQKPMAALWAISIGLGSTLIYDLLTNLASILAFDLGETSALGYLLAGVPMALLHMGSNAVIFAVLMPLLLPRLAGLNRAALVGRNGAALLATMLMVAFATPSQAQLPAVVDTSAVVVAAPADTIPDVDQLEAPKSKPETAPETAPEATSIPEAELSGPAKAFGWERPLWNPFARTALEYMNWYSNRVTLVDGGVGAAAVVMGEAGTSWNPTVERDGILVGTGHIMADDPWIVPTEGLVVDRMTDARDGHGGTGGLVALRTEDPDPGKAVSAYRGAKGNHESYFRSIHLLTPKAAWRAGFEFEESLDIEGYNYTTQDDATFLNSSANEFPGHSRVRQSRTRLFRELDTDKRFIFEYSNARLTKDGLPAYGAEHLEIWDDALAVTMQSGGDSWRYDAQVFWRNRDVAWGERDILAVMGENKRLLETGREGVSLDLYRSQAEDKPVTGLKLQATSWYIDDSLTTAWRNDFGGTGEGDGQTANAALRTGVAVGATQAAVTVGADWHSLAGVGPEASVKLGANGEKPWWTASVHYGGRAPRSDELLTPLRRDVAERELLLLPNGDLDREQTARLGLILQARLLGFDLAVDGSMTQLRDGITWVAQPGESDVGSWRNDLEMDSSRVTGTLGREGRFLGWGRLMLEGTWQQMDEKVGQASFLPPEQYLRSHVMWENHFFKEDGILQLALYSTLQGEMADPWDVTRTALLPSRTVHDLLVGFRLVGANLSLAFRNLTGERTRLTSGALSTGQELDLRLHWSWVY